MKLNVISVCSQCTAEELLNASPRARAQSDFLKLEWQHSDTVRDMDGFLDVLQQSVNENPITVILDGSEGYYTKSMIAEGLDLQLEEDAECRRALEAYCQPRGISLSGRMLEGARIPEGAQPLCSSETVDQGFILVRGGRCIVVFPAAKKGFDDMFAKGFYPFLLRHGAETAVVQTMAIRGSKVKDVEEYLRLFRYGKNILPLVYQENGEFYFSVTAIRQTESESRQACNSLIENIREEMGDFILTPSNAKKDAKQAKKEKKKSKALREIEEYDPVEEESKPKKKEGMGFFRKFLIFICLCTFAVSSGYLALRYYRSVSNLQEYDSLREVYDNGGFAPIGFPGDYDDAFSGLYQINKDVVGWLSIEGTSLDYPVVQTTDNEYYHRLNFEGESNLHGVPYVDYNVDMKAPSTNTIIYGHNIKNDDQMFNSLLQYWKPEHFKEHPVVEFHTVYGKRQYKIFAAFVANVNPSHGEVFKYHTFVDADSVADIQEFLYNVQIRSVLNTGVDVQPSDELLTLSTCTYEFDNARFVIVARRLRDGESAEIDPSLVSKNSAALMPDIWYELYGGTKPVLSAPTFNDTIVLENTVPEKQPEETPKEEEVKEETPPVQQEQTVTTQNQSPAQNTVVPPPVTETPTTTTPPPAEQPAPAPEVQTPPVTEPPVQETQPQEQPKEETAPPAPPAPTPEEVIEEEYVPFVPTTTKKEPVEETPKQEEQPKQEETPKEEAPKEEEKESSYDESEKLSVKINGQKTTKSAYDIVCMMVQAEMGTTFEQEALKAQAVAAYTFVKYNNASGIAPAIAAKTSISNNVAKAVKAVIGEAVYYKGAYANTTYCAANAGVSNNCVDVWGGNLPYLVSVDSVGDEKTNHYGYETKLSLDYVADRIEDYHNIDPYEYSDDPSDWFGKVTYGAGKYVNTVKLCGSNIKGRLVREGLLQSKIRSAAFEVDYDEDSESFIFTTYGYGHGVGMSQLGANYYAKQGWDYVEILEHYYSNTTVK